MSVFVTVGTTSFDTLIETLDNPTVHSKLRELGYRKLVMQIGRGSYEPSIINEPADDDPDYCASPQLLQVTYYRFKPSLAEDMAAAQFIISHAGAGSCLEALSAQKRLLVVVNEELMHNHQTELARALADRQYCLYTTCSQLSATMERHSNRLSVTSNSWKTFPPPQTERFSQFLDSIMGFDVTE